MYFQFRIVLSNIIALHYFRNFNIRIEIEDESYAKTYIDNVLVDERGGNFAYGRIGFRQAHDDAYGKTEIALFDDVVIKVKTTSGSSGVVFEEDFSDTNPFSEGFVVSERLRVEGQMSRDILAWLYDVPDAISSIPASSANFSKPQPKRDVQKITNIIDPTGNKILFTAKIRKL